MNCEFIKELEKLNINPIYIKPYLKGYRLYCNDENSVINNIIKLKEFYPTFKISWDAIEFNKHSYIIITIFGVN